MYTTSLREELFYKILSYKNIKGSTISYKLSKIKRLYLKVVYEVLSTKKHYGSTVLCTKKTKVAILS